MFRAILVAVLMCTSAGAQVQSEQITVGVDHDAELADALRTLNVRFWSHRTPNRLTATRYYFNVFLSVLGAGSVLALRRFYPEIKTFTHGRPPAWLERAKQFADRQGRRQAMALGAFAVGSHLIGRWYDAADTAEANNVKHEAARDARIYRTYLAQFFSLSPAEQFLVAKQDEAFARDLITFAEILRRDPMIGYVRLPWPIARLQGFEDGPDASRGANPTAPGL